MASLLRIEKSEFERLKELNKYQYKKLGMFEWYKILNTFLENINKM